MASQLYEYRVLTVRDSAVGRMTTTAELQRTLNEQALDGWRLLSTTGPSLSGTFPTRDVPQVVLILERPK